MRHQGFLLLLLFFISLQLVLSHYSHYPTTGADWKDARATFYAAADPNDAVGGACGYGDLVKNGYGKATAALSSVLYQKGQICGACFEIRCVNDLKWCIPGTSIIVTATNFCAPNYGFEADGGGQCNPPNAHFVLPIEAFEKIAIWKASNMPVQYRRINCRKDGGIRFTIGGAGIFLSVLISNVGGAGDVTAVKIKGSRTGWLPMGRNWGQNWHVNADLKNQPLSFEVTSSDGVALSSYNVAPKNWEFAQTFEADMVEPGTPWSPLHGFHYGLSPKTVFGENLHVSKLVHVLLRRLHYGCSMTIVHGWIGLVMLAIIGESSFRLNDIYEMLKIPRLPITRILDQVNKGQKNV